MQKVKTVRHKLTEVFPNSEHQRMPEAAVLYTIKGHFQDLPRPLEVWLAQDEFVLEYPEV